MLVREFDHVALWVDRRDDLSAFLCGPCGMHEIERTDTFTLVGGDAKRGKLTLFEAEGLRERGVLGRIGLRVPDPATCLKRAHELGLAISGNGAMLVDAPGNVPLALLDAPADGIADLDHVVLRVPDPGRTTSAFERLGFDQVDGRLEVGERSILLEERSVTESPRPLLNHLALLVESLEVTLKEAAWLELTVDRVVDAPNTLAAFIEGPDGVMVEYVEHKPGFALV